MRYGYCLGLVVASLMLADQLIAVRCLEVAVFADVDALSAMACRIDLDNDGCRSCLSRCRDDLRFSGCVRKEYVIFLCLALCESLCDDLERCLGLHAFPCKGILDRNVRDILRDDLLAVVPCRLCGDLRDPYGLVFILRVEVDRDRFALLVVDALRRDDFASRERCGVILKGNGRFAFCRFCRELGCRVEEAVVLGRLDQGSDDFLFRGTACCLVDGDDIEFCVGRSVRLQRVSRLRVSEETDGCVGLACSQSFVCDRIDLDRLPGREGDMLPGLGVRQCRSKSRYNNGLLLVFTVRVLPYKVLACVIH